MKKVSWFLLLCALYPEAAQAQSPPPTPSVKIIDLGVLPGLPGSVYQGYSVAHAINNAGVVVGEASTVPRGCVEFSPTGTPSHHAFRWTPDSGIHDLGVDFNCQSAALGISDDGAIVGSSYASFQSQFLSLFPPRAVLWPSGGVQSDIGIPPLCNAAAPFYCNVYAYGINPTDDTVVGQAYGPGGASGGFIWRQGQGFQDLAKNIFPFAINASGVMACLDANAGSANQVACLRKPDGTIVDLAAGGTFCEALALNANNESVGYCGTLSGPDTAISWDSTGSARTLGVNGVAYGINSGGVVVGVSEDSFGDFSPGGAFMWTKTNGSVLLSTLLPPGSGWRLDTVSAINDQNQIVGAGLHNGVQRAFLLNLSPCMDAGGDTDGDGLCDDWEKNGLFVNVNGNSMFLDLPAMGADPNHKDVFVQLDTVGDGIVTQAALNVVIAAFANASVPYPDGTTGNITLHVDNGPNSIMDPVTGAQWGVLSRSASISDVANLGNFDTNGVFAWDIFDAQKKLDFPAERAPAFHYAISEPVQLLNADGTAGAGGIARDIPSSDFIVAIGHTPDYPDAWVGSIFMHELGHNLGLGHGGGDDINRKPNYLSIMNYEFTYDGLQPGNVYDYSRFGPDSDPSHRLPVLDEAHLNETTGLGTLSVPVGANALRYKSVRYCPGDFTNKKTINPLNQPIDWDCNKVGNQDDNATDIAVDGVNGDPSEAKAAEDDGGKPILLSPYDDWAHLVFNGGGIGSLANAPLPSTTQNTEPTPAQLQEFADFWAAQQQDNIPPTTTVMLSPQPNAAGWNNQNVTVTLNATDNTGGSGVKQITYSAVGAQAFSSTIANGVAESLVINTEGVTTITFSATDNAGNAETPHSVTVKLDKTPPTISATRTPPPNSHGWNNSSVTVNFLCSDDLSGLAQGSPPAASVVSTEGEGQSVTGSCMDIAGNSASATVGNINIDKTPPTITGSRAPLGNSNGWNNTDVTVSFTCSDSLSGVDTCGPSNQVISSEGANQSRSGTAVDLAGNSASVTVSGINIDKTPPTMNCSANPSLLWPPNHKLVNVNTIVLVSDSLSGPAGFSLLSVSSNEPDSGLGDIQGWSIGRPSTSGQLRSERLGTGTGRVYTFIYQGLDQAGNNATCTPLVVVPHDQGH
jgi:hypothetical protein